MPQLIHIGYGDSAKDCLLEAIQDHGLSGDGALPSRDDFTQGPISKCLAPEGILQRIEYWNTVDAVIGFGFDTENFYLESMKLLDDLECDEITIWVGDSCHDILATGWLLLYLGFENFKWNIVDLATVDKEDFSQDTPAVNLAMYTPDQVEKLYKYRRPLVREDIEYYSSIWNKAAEENGPYRIKKNDQILTVGEDYFDDYLLSYLRDDFEPMSLFIGGILRDGKHRISDTTVEWNIRKLIDRGLIDFEGNLNSITAYAIRKK